MITYFNCIKILFPDRLTLKCDLDSRNCSLRDFVEEISFIAAKSNVWTSLPFGFFDLSPRKLKKCIEYLICFSPNLYLLHELSRSAQFVIFNFYLSRIEAAIVDALPVPSPPAFKSSILAIFLTFKFINGIKM